MKTALLVVTVLAGLGTLTTARADDPSPTSMFGRLQTQFEQGTQPNLQPLVDKMDSGRCFTWAAPDGPAATGLSVQKAVVDNGPIGSGQAQYVVSVSLDQDLPANYFDDAAVTDMNVDQKHLPLSPVDPQSYQMNLKDGSSIQLRSVATASGAMIVLRGRAVSGDTTLMCYYFKPH